MSTLVPGARCRVPGAGCRVLGAIALAAIAVGAPVARAEAQQPRQAPRVQMPTLPLTQLDDRQQAAELDSRTFTVSFVQPTPLRDALVMLVRGTSLSIVPDPDVAGSFIGELKNVTVRRALDTILPPFGFDYSVDGSVIRVFKRERETRIFDLNYIALSRTAAATIGTPRAEGRSYAQVATSSSGDVFTDIARSVPTLLSEHATFSVDRKAGLLQATDYPERLERVANYLDAVQDRIQRQVQIDARVIELEVDESSPPSAAAARVVDVDSFLAGLAAQGKVTTLATPRLLTMNNEPAIVRGVNGGRDGTDALTLSVTPQIGDGAITLSFSPIVELHGAESDRRREPAVEREADTLARVADGETLVVSGFSRQRNARETKAVGAKGGWFGRSTVVTRKRVEILVLLTPRIVNPIGAQD